MVVKKTTTKKPVVSKKPQAPKKWKKTTEEKKIWAPKKEYLDTFKVQKILEILRIDWTLEEAWSYANISKSSHYSRIEQKKTFLDKNDHFEEVEILYEDAIEHAKNYAWIYARKTVFKAIVKWDEKISMEYLKRRDPRYRDKQELTGKDWEQLQSPSVIFYIPDNKRNNDTSTWADNNKTTGVISGEST